MIKVNLLPKTLRKRVEPGWWRLIAILFPLIVLGTIAALQIGQMANINATVEQRENLKAEVKALQRYVQGKDRLNTQQKTLQQVVEVKKQIEQDEVNWSEELSLMLAKLPRNGTRSTIALNSLNLTRADPNQLQGAYDGRNVVSEFKLTGKTKNSGDVVKLLAAFENDKRFGAQMGQMQYEKESKMYSFNANIGVVSDKPIAKPATTTTQPTTTFQGNPIPPTPTTPTQGGGNAQ